MKEKLMKGLHHRGIQVILSVLMYLLLAEKLPLEVHQGFFAISLSIQWLLMWALPVVILFFISHTICSFQRQAPLFILALFLFETLSNFASVWYAFAGGHIASSALPPMTLSNTSSSFNPLWQLAQIRPTWWSAEKGTALGMLLGCLAAFAKSQKLSSFIQYGKEKAQWALTHLFAPTIPLFILGFIARMYNTHVLQQVCSQYSILILCLVALLTLYMWFLLLLGNKGSFAGSLRDMKNLLPPTGLAFSSGSSLATMPWTISGTAKNLKNPEFAQAVIPATTNIQQIGDCITNSFLCFVIYTHFFGHAPDLITWAHFSLIYVLARFATAAVLGGAIFIMLPIYEGYLSFTPEMIALILAFNVLLDPLVTSCNVFANGALCRVFEKVWLSFQRKPVTPTP